MTTIQQSTNIQTGLCAGKPLEERTFDSIRRQMMLDFCKWDPQIGDVATLADFPLILRWQTWRELALDAEMATAELLSVEGELLHRPDLHRLLALPWRIRRVLRRAAPQTPGPRIMRFDFHLTDQGWRVSEVNSDVPGGFTESSTFTSLMAQHCNASPAGDPAAAWADAIVSAAKPGIAAMISATGYLEDLQIMKYLSARLEERGLLAHLASPQQLCFTDSGATILHGNSAIRAGIIVRFVQAEWLARLPNHCGWPKLFTTGIIPVANPASSILTESKRLPLVASFLQTKMPTWQRLLPENRDPRNAPWTKDDHWLVKTAFCNTGDTVCIRGLLPDRQWRRAARSVRWWPNSWIAQRRFRILPIDSARGLIYPCIGVYTVNGKAAGIYGRFSRNALIDYAAIDAAVLIHDGEFGEHRNG